MTFFELEEVSNPVLFLAMFFSFILGLKKRKTIKLLSAKYTLIIKDAVSKDSLIFMSMFLKS